MLRRRGDREEENVVRDQIGREISYLRISVTDRCNLRCVYCMPPEGVEKRRHEEILSFEEIEEIAQAAVELGVRKIRITGGEPLARRGVVELCRRLGCIRGVEDLSMTTNGTLLPPVAAALFRAGIHRINISLDTLQGEKYRTITRGGRLEDALEGIRVAMEVGMNPIKINTVLIGGFNDDEIPALVDLTRRAPLEVRFIELMPVGCTQAFGPAAYLPCQSVLERVPQLQPVDVIGVTERYRLPGAPGRVGLIRPLSHHFCARCDRLRLTADGTLKPCLHSAEEVSLRGLHGEQLRQQILEAVRCKPAQHGPLSWSQRSETERNMNEIGG